MIDGHPAAHVHTLWSRITVPAIIDKLLRIGEGKILRQLETISKAVNAIEDDFVKMTDDELRGMTAEFRARLEQGEDLDDHHARGLRHGARGLQARARPCAPSTCRSWAARRCTSATSPR